MDDPIKGFRDFYPDEMGPRRAVIDTIESVSRRYGYREIGTPALEPTQLYIDKSGEEIVEELYSFTDQGGRELALTPELTPTVARMVVAKQQALSKPIKWRSTRPFWRYEEPQQGRFREFYQTNVDCFGSAEPMADAEILALTANSLTALGLDRESFEFRISHRDILGGLLESFDADITVGGAIRAVDKREKIDLATYYELLENSGLTTEQASTFDELLAVESLDELLDYAEGDRLTSAITNLQDVLANAEELGVRQYCTLSLDTARGLDYYTGTVFECFDSTGSVSRAVFGGGRYDELIEGYGGQPTPAVGVAFGHATLSLLLDNAGVLPDESLQTDYYVLTVGETRAVATEIVQSLRNSGHVVETDIADRSFGSQMGYADSIGAETVIIVGERDLENDEVTIKAMDSGEQTTVPLAAIREDTSPTVDDYA